MDEILYDIKDVKLHRDLPQFWSGKKLGYEGKAVNGAIEIARYAEKMYYSLLCIRHYYKDFFNKNNTTTIDEYIHVFNSLYSEIFETIADKNSMTIATTKLLFSGPSWKTRGRFVALQNSGSYKRNAFVFKGGIPVGFTEETYEKIKPLAKKIFMLEKLCSFTTRKIWSEELTKPENFDATKDYKVLARVIMPKTWRRHEHDDSYENDRIYFSTSLIDKKNRNKLFMRKFVDEMAILLIEYSDENFVCADVEDNFSEETIDGYNPNIYDTKYTDVFAVDKVLNNGKNHKFFANAVEIATPMSILRNIYQSLYSEINMKNPKVFGVVAPNEKSVEFAKNKAKELGVRYIPPEEFNS